MRELTPTQIATFERLIVGGFTPFVLPLYPGAIGIRRGSVAALFEPEEDSGLRILMPPSLMIDGNFSVRVRRDGREWFVWKSKQVETTREVIDEVARFSADLSALLSIPPQPPNVPA